MRRIRNGLMTLAGVAALAGAYWAGATGRPEPTPIPIAGPSAVIAPPIIAPPTLGPIVTIENATGVLLGDVKVPDDLLRQVPSPPRPDLIIPEIPK